MTQNHSASLLVELLTEELPPKALARLGDAFAEGIAQRLAARDLIEGELAFERYATPRRLAVVVQNVRAVAPDRQVRDKVLPVSVAGGGARAPGGPRAGARRARRANTRTRRRAAARRSRAPRRCAAPLEAAKWAWSLSLFVVGGGPGGPTAS